MSRISPRSAAGSTDSGSHSATTMRATIRRWRRSAIPTATSSPSPRRPDDPSRPHDRAGNCFSVAVSNPHYEQEPPMNRLLFVVLYALVVPPAAQQPDSLRFDVASVKRNTTAAPRTISSPRFQGTTFTASNVALEMLITSAYGVPSRDVMDAPDWVLFDFNGGERFDVTAKFAEGTSVQGQRT